MTLSDLDVAVQSKASRLLKVIVMMNGRCDR
jgi:hypothetical protein